MIRYLDSKPITSMIAVILALVGAFLCIVGTLDYGEYLEKLGIAIGGLGLLGVARSMTDKGGLSG